MGYSNAEACKRLYDSSKRVISANSVHLADGRATDGGSPVRIFYSYSRAVAVHFPGTLLTLSTDIMFSNMTNCHIREALSHMPSSSLHMCVPDKILGDVLNLVKYDHDGALSMNDLCAKLANPFSIVAATKERTCPEDIGWARCRNKAEYNCNILSKFLGKLRNFAIAQKVSTVDTAVVSACIKRLEEYLVFMKIRSNQVLVRNLRSHGRREELKNLFAWDYELGKQD